MAFPTGWVAVQLKISQANVSGSANHTNFPVVIVDGALPSFVYAGAKSDGSDLRFSTDSAGATQIPFEIVTFDRTNELCEIHVKLPTLYYNQDTTFYVWYGNASATALAASDTYGSQNVWASQYQAVYHGNNLNDSTANARTLSQGGTVSIVDGALGKAFSATWNGTNYLRDTAGGYNPGTGVVALQAIMKKNGASANDYTPTIVSIGIANPRISIVSAKTTGYAYLQSFDGASSDLATTVNIADNTNKYLVGVRNGTSLKFYVNGSANSTTGTVRNINADTLGIGQYNSGGFDYLEAAIIDEVRVLSAEPSADWVATEQTMFADPDAFVALGVIPATITTETPASAITSNSAEGGGNVTDAGNGTISERGIVWGTSANPTTAGNKQTTTGTTGAFSGVAMTGLLSNTLYYYRAYAINEAGTAYGADVTFTTQNAVISGTCTLAGSPVLGAIVTLIDSATDTVVATDTSDASGNYDFGGLDVTKTYHVVAEYEDSPDQYNAKSLPFMTPEEI